jgi:hypothetical protein
MKPAISLAPRAALLFVLLVAAFNSPARAADNALGDYEVGANLVCDTQGQVERFASLFTGDAQAAIRLVNAEEHNPSACAIVVKSLGTATPLSGPIPTPSERIDLST